MIRSALIGIERLGDGRRAAVVADLAGLPPRKLLGHILRLIEIQDALAVAGVVVVGLREGFGPVLAVTIARLERPTNRWSCCAGITGLCRARAMSRCRSCGEPRALIASCGFREGCCEPCGPCVSPVVSQ